MKLNIQRFAPDSDTTYKKMAMGDNTPIQVESAVRDGRGYTIADHYQMSLVSGTNIKTINNTSVLGSGNISVQPTLTSGTNIKTVNSTSLLGSGNVAVQPTLVSGTNIKTVNSTSLLGSGNVAVQPTLVSGTNIKTINNTSLLSSGNMTLLTENDIYYKKNDTYEADYIYIGGLLSNSSKGVYFTIFLPKSFKPNGTGDYNITTATINTCNFYIRKSNGGYLENGTTKSTFSSIEYRDFTDNRLTFVCTKSSAYSSATNNTPIGVELRNVKVTFS